MSRGISLAIIGCDGSGKSAVVDVLADRLADRFPSIEVHHLRPHFISMRKRSPNAGPVTNPHGNPPYGSTLSIIKAVYLFADYTLGHRAVITPQLALGSLVIWDRYAYDLAIDPRRLRYGGPIRLAQWLALHVPQPDLVVVLDAPVDTLLARKQEVSESELCRQRNAYLRLAHSLTHARVVANDVDVEAAALAVERHVIAFLQTQDRAVRRRHGVPAQ